MADTKKAINGIKNPDKEARKNAKESVSNPLVLHDLTDSTKGKPETQRIDLTIAAVSEIQNALREHRDLLTQILDMIG